MLVGEAEIKPRKGLLAAPEEACRCPCWSMEEGSGDLWAQALRLPLRHHNWSLALGHYMANAFAYQPMLVTSPTESLLLYRHQALELHLVQALAEPKPFWKP